MKNEYLTRTATIVPENVEKLVAEVGSDLVARDDVDLRDTLGIGIVGVTVKGALVEEIFGESTEAVTISGAEFAAKAAAAARHLFGNAMEANDALPPEGRNINHVFNLMGTVSVLLLGVEDKLFDSDHVEEHEAVKKEETNE